MKTVDIARQAKRRAHHQGAKAAKAEAKRDLDDLLYGQTADKVVKVSKQLQAVLDANLQLYHSYEVMILRLQAQLTCVAGQQSQEIPLLNKANTLSFECSLALVSAVQASKSGDPQFLESLGAVHQGVRVTGLDGTSKAFLMGIYTLQPGMWVSNRPVYKHEGRRTAQGQGRGPLPVLLRG
jgi:hypothetical protein